MIKEFCDLCGEKEPNHKFKVKMSKIGILSQKIITKEFFKRKRR